MQTHLVVVLDVVESERHSLKPPQEAGSVLHDPADPEVAFVPVTAHSKALVHQQTRQAASKLRIALRCKCPTNCRVSGICEYGSHWTVHSLTTLPCSATLSASVGSFYPNMTFRDEEQVMLACCLLPCLRLADLHALAQVSHATRGLVQV